MFASIVAWHLNPHGFVLLGNCNPQCCVSSQVPLTTLGTGSCWDPIPDLVHLKAAEQTKCVLQGTFLEQNTLWSYSLSGSAIRKCPVLLKQTKIREKKKPTTKPPQTKPPIPPKKNQTTKQTQKKQNQKQTKNPTNNTTPKTKPKQQTHHSKCWKALDLALYIMGFQANPDPIAKGCLLREASAQTAVSICLTTSHMEGNCAYNVKSEYTFIISGSGLLSWVLDNLHEKLMYLICEASSVFWLLWKQLWSHFSILQFD